MQDTIVNGYSKRHSMRLNLILYRIYTQLQFPFHTHKSQNTHFGCFFHFFVLFIFYILQQSTYRREINSKEKGRILSIIQNLKCSAKRSMNGQIWHDYKCQQTEQTLRICHQITNKITGNKANCLDNWWISTIQGSFYDSFIVIVYI